MIVLNLASPCRSQSAANLLYIRRLLGSHLDNVLFYETKVSSLEYKFSISSAYLNAINLELVG